MENLTLFYLMTYYKALVINSVDWPKDRQIHEWNIL